MITVAVLCVQKKSAYQTIEGVELFDKSRDARNFSGGMPIVAHPPCRAWSAFTRHQAKPEPGEKDLGLWCAEQVKQWGGILEQPAHSKLWEAAGLPKPGTPVRRDFWAVEVCQQWWSYCQLKRTWLFFSKISPSEVHYPLQLHTAGRDRRNWQMMAKNKRSLTVPALAQWLVDLARKAE